MVPIEDGKIIVPSQPLLNILYFAEIAQYESGKCQKRTRLGYTTRLVANVIGKLYDL